MPASKVIAITIMTRCKTIEIIRFLVLLYLFESLKYGNNVNNTAGMRNNNSHG